ncbi:MAG TPA: hypothetical protein VMS93_08150, partial [Candidatus Saccharimonadales bacterium]|nr:hypothetical protein [Candidatus Saccharimonadales bacterium]
RGARSERLRKGPWLLGFLAPRATDGKWVKNRQGKICGRSRVENTPSQVATASAGGAVLDSPHFGI